MRFGTAVSAIHAKSANRRRPRFFSPPFFILFILPQTVALGAFTALCPVVTHDLAMYARDAFPTAKREILRRAIARLVGIRAFYEEKKRV